MYHAHSAADAADGLAGAFIVRQSPRVEALQKLYDVDATEHTIFVSEWGHSMGPLAGILAAVPDAETLLINGKGHSTESPDAPLSKFTVKNGKRYRFRLAYGGGSKSCAVKFAIDQHVLKLVTLDGHAIEPEDVYSIQLGRGERADFILDANKVSGVFKIRVVAEKSCQENLEGAADLVYQSDKTVLHKVEPSSVDTEFTTLFSDRCKLDNVLCLGEVRAAVGLPTELASTVDEIIYVPLNYSTKQISAKRVGEFNEYVWRYLLF